MRAALRSGDLPEDSTNSPDRIACQALEIACSTVGASAGALLRLEPSKSRLALVHTIGVAAVGESIEAPFAVPPALDRGRMDQFADEVALQLSSQVTPPPPSPFCGISIVAADKVIGVVALYGSGSVMADERIRRVVSAMVQFGFEVSSIWIEHREQRLNSMHRLKQTERLALLGESMSSVVHEINNPLTAVIGFASLVQDRVTQVDREGGEALRAIISETRRAADLVQSVLVFARRDEERSCEIFDVNELIDRVALLRKMPQRQANIQFVGTRSSKPAYVDCRASQLLQVALNLVVNAEQAIGPCRHDGRIDLIVQIVGEVVRVTVHDNGPGVPVVVQSRIFEPFFTTKPAGKGSGLGLSVSRAIMSEHNGALSLGSSSSDGAEFYFELPAAVPKLIAGTVPAFSQDRGDRFALDVQPGAQIVAPCPAVLVVDDEESIRATARGILSRRRLRIETAPSSSEALRMLEARSFDLILCDVYLPGMNGLRLYEAIRQLHPRYRDKFALMTGFRESPELEVFLAQHRVDCLAKPFSVDQLCRFVQTRVSSGDAAEPVRLQ